MVREGGVEPPRPFGHTDLNRARLPIPPLAPEASQGYPTPWGVPKLGGTASTAWPSGHLSYRFLLRDEEEVARARTICTVLDNGHGTMRVTATVPTLAGAILKKILDQMASPRRGRFGATTDQIGVVGNPNAQGSTGPGAAARRWSRWSSTCPPTTWPARSERSEEGEVRAARSATSDVREGSRHARPTRGRRLMGLAPGATEERRGGWLRRRQPRCLVPRWSRRATDVTGSTDPEGLG